MSRLSIRNDYFEWLLDLVSTDKNASTISYRQLMTRLHNTEFTYELTGDVDRAYDGIALRHRYANQNDNHDYDYIRECLSGPCSILEMMIALSLRCEEQIMSDPAYGNRTGQWFWRMIVSLGLGSMIDSTYDEFHVEWTIGRFLNREYEANGRGGLFTVRNCRIDFRKAEIWKQMCYFLDTMC